MNKINGSMIVKGSALIGAGALLLAASNSGFWGHGEQDHQRINSATIGFTLDDTQYYTVTDDGYAQEIADNSSWRVSPGDIVESHVGINLDITGRMSAKIDLNDMIPETKKKSLPQSEPMKKGYEYSISLIDDEGIPLKPVSADTPTEFHVTLTGDKRSDRHDQSVVADNVGDDDPELFAVLRIQIDEHLDSRDQLDDVVSIINTPTRVSIHQVQ